VESGRRSNELKIGVIATPGTVNTTIVVYEARFTIFVSVTCRYVTDVLPLLPLRNRSHLPIHSCRGGQNAEIVSSQSKIACYPLPYKEGRQS